MVLKVVDGEPERRSLLRLRTGHEQLRLKDNGKIYPVADLSVAGLSVRIPEDQDMVYFTIGRESSGTLALDGDKVPVKFRVIHVGHGGVIGAEFVDLQTEVVSVLEDFLSPERIAASLQALPPASGLTLWLTGQSGAQVLVWENKRLVVLCGGAFLEWADGVGIQTGRYMQASAGNDASGTWGILERDSVSFVPDPRPDPATVSVAKRLILGCNVSSQVSQILGDLALKLEAFRLEK